MKTIILPGMGADANMYPKKQYQSLQDVLFVNWPKYDGEKSLEAVAQKIIDQYKIGSKMVVGGSSFGGMVAIEIAKILGLKKVILIGSATSPGYINPLLQKLSNLSEITPVKIIQVFTGKVNRYSRNDLLKMFEESESEFIKAMCKALFKWEGLGNFNGDISQIHGEKNLIIFPPKKYARIIPNGGHLISMSHAEEVANFINKNKA
jgi:pimeloyl-ACP methyl ester carboxylesterase